MNRLIQLLSEKNHFLEKFMSKNEKQIIQLQEGNFDKIESFYNQREQIIKIIKYIDSEINKIQTSEQKYINYSNDEKKIIKESLQIKSEYTLRILDQDLQVLSLIDQAKSLIIQELKTIRNGKRALAGYKPNLDI